MSELLHSANIDTCDCSKSNSAALIGGIVAAVEFLLITALTVSVMVVPVLRRCRRSYSVKDRYVKLTSQPGYVCVSICISEPVDIAEELELSKFSGEAYKSVLSPMFYSILLILHRNPEGFATSSDEAYNVVSQNRGIGEGDDGDYETVRTFSCSQQPTAIRGRRGDDGYVMPNFCLPTATTTPAAAAAAKESAS